MNNKLWSSGLRHWTQALPKLHAIIACACIIAGSSRGDSRIVEGERQGGKEQVEQNECP